MFSLITMKPYWIKTHRLVKKCFPGFVWDVPNNENKVYLTFDDGPTPEITEWVLDILKQHDIKATFFCIGKNIKQYPEIFRKVIEGGHAIGNHTYSHVNGWQTENERYFENTALTEEYLIENGISTKLFRPPYGKIKRSQAAFLRNKGYKIIMWDVLSADFDRKITPGKCLKNVIDNTGNGSIIIFHDSVKAYPNLKYTLPKVIDYLKRKNFSFDKIG